MAWEPGAKASLSLEASQYLATLRSFSKLITRHIVPHGILIASRLTHRFETGLSGSLGREFNLFPNSPVVTDRKAGL